MNQDTFTADAVLYEASRSLWMMGKTSLACAAALLLGFIVSAQLQTLLYLFAGFLVGLALMARGLMIYASLSAVITTRRITVTHSLLRHSSASINLTRIESVDVYQGVFQRLMNYGDVSLRGMGSEDIFVSNITDPNAFKDAIFLALDKISGATF